MAISVSRVWLSSRVESGSALIRMACRDLLRYLREPVVNWKVLLDLPKEPTTNRTFTMDDSLVTQIDDVIKRCRTDRKARRFASRSFFVRVALYWFGDPMREYLIPPQLLQLPPPPPADLPPGVGKIIRKSDEICKSK